MRYRINNCGDIKAHLQRCVQLVFGFLKKFLVNGLEWQFTERGQLKLLQRGKALVRETERKRQVVCGVRVLSCVICITSQIMQRLGESSLVAIATQSGT